MADVLAHLDGAHGVAADAGGEHLREEEALQVGGAQPLPAEQRSVGRPADPGADQHAPLEHAGEHGHRGEGQGGGDPARIGVGQAGGGLGNVHGVQQECYPRQGARDLHPWRAEHGAGEAGGALEHA